jgi:hypothetical protein
VAREIHFIFCFLRLTGEAFPPDFIYWVQNGPLYNFTGHFVHTPQHKGKQWHNHRYTKGEKKNNIKAHELFNDTFREVNDAAT